MKKGTYLVDVAHSVDEERSLQREQRDEGCNGVQWHHDHDSYDLFIQGQDHEHASMYALSTENGVARTVADEVSYSF